MKDLGYYWKSISSIVNDRSGRGDFVVVLCVEIYEKDKEFKYFLCNECYLIGIIFLNCIKILILNVCVSFNVCMYICVVYD